MAVTVTREGVEGGSRLVVVRPDAGLDPLETYEVQTRFLPDCNFDCLVSTHQTVATFTTGSGPLIEPPVFAGLEGARARPEICTSDACCGPYRVVRLDLTWTWSADPLVVGYRVYQDGTLVSAVGSSLGALGCSGWYPFDGFNTFKATSGSYSVRAVNIAGLEDTNAATVPVTLSCDGVLDAGIDDPSAQRDGPVPDSPAPIYPNVGADCSAAAPASASASAVRPVLALLLLPAAIRSRRRRR